MKLRTCKRSTTPALASLAFAALSLCAGRADAAVCEAEPTDMSLEYGDPVTCAIEPTTDTDLFRFTGRAGNRVLAEALFVSGASFNPRIQVLAPDGSQLINTWSPARADLVLSQTGTYTAVIFNAGFGAGEYVFTVSCLAGSCVPDPPPPPSPAPGGDIACEAEPTDMFPHYGTRVTCAIDPETDTDLYRFVANAGDRILAEALFVSGTSFNPRIQLIAPDGSQLVNTWSPARADVVLPQTGIYTVVIFNAGFSPGEYAFTVSCTAGKCLPGVFPNVIFTLTGCTTCQPGDQFTVQARWTNHGETSARVEVKAGLRLPSGVTSNTLGNRHLEFVAPAGLNVTANLLSFVWPVGLPTGTWTFEGALLGPDLGETFAREVRTFTVEP